MYDTQAIIRHAFRVSKVRGESAIRVRVPGGRLPARHLGIIQELAETFGNGTVHLTTRQGYEIPGVKLAELDAIKHRLADMIREIESDCGVILEEAEKGYPAAGTRNVSSCIGNQVCRFANCDTTALAQDIEKVIYPNHYHLKVAITGCPNDCIKAHTQDLGIVCNIVPEYDQDRCIACEACVDNCRKKITNALSMENFTITKHPEYCLKCGECILKCPTGALARGEKVFRVLLGGRTGKRNPRLANTFLDNATRDIVLQVCRNVYAYIGIYIDRSKPKEHLGYIIDRTGFDTFKSVVLDGVELDSQVRVVEPDNPGYRYPRRK